MVSCTDGTIERIKPVSDVFGGSASFRYFKLEFATGNWNLHHHAAFSFINLM